MHPTSPSDRQINVPWGPERTALGVAALVAASAATIGVVLLIWRGDAPLLAILGSTLALEIGLVTAAYKLGPAGRGAFTLLYGPIHLGSLRLFGWGAAALVSSLTLSIIYVTIAGAVSADLVPPPLPEDLNLSELRWVAFAVIVVIGPFAEETFFRGFLFAGLLNRFGTAKSTLISAAVFGVAHVDVALFAPAFLSGVVFALVYKRTGSVWPAVLAHTAQNAIAFGLTQ